MSLSHDQNFKNLTLDYLRQALTFSAAAAAIDAQVRITPVRREQLRERLGECFREIVIRAALEDNEWAQYQNETIPTRPGP